MTRKHAIRVYRGRDGKAIAGLAIQTPGDDEAIVVGIRGAEIVADLVPRSQARPQDVRPETLERRGIPLAVDALDEPARVSAIHKGDAVTRTAASLRVALRLALQVRTGATIRIVYRKEDGSVSERLLLEPTLRGRVLVARDADRDAPRSFRLDRILEVSRVEGQPWETWVEGQGYVDPEGSP